MFKPLQLVLAQLVERRIVVPQVDGSNPSSEKKFNNIIVILLNTYVSYIFIDLSFFCKNKFGLNISLKLKSFIFISLFESFEIPYNS